jgi:hypothetical protein
MGFSRLGHALPELPNDTNDTNLLHAHGSLL